VAPPNDVGRIRVYLASSIDGFIAGPGDDLSWLPEPDSDAPLDDRALDFASFIHDVGALLMGRRTYDVVRAFDVPWPYADRPVLVATRRDLDEGAPHTVTRVEGPIDQLVSRAREAAAGKDVYLDGGELIRQACEADLVDELTITLAPVALGEGRPLFTGISARYPMSVVSVHPFPGGMVQLRLEPVRGTAALGSHEP
jgi:dihydrofolate reductase